MRLAVGRLHRRLSRRAVGGLTPSQLSVLVTVEQHGPLRLGELANREVITPPTVTRLVASLHERELVKRVTDPEDGRAALIEVADAGRALLDEIRRERTAFIAQRIARLDPAVARRGRRRRGAAGAAASTSPRRAEPAGRQRPGSPGSGVTALAGAAPPSSRSRVARTAAALRTSDGQQPMRRRAGRPDRGRRRRRRAGLRCRRGSARPRRVLLSGNGSAYAGSAAGGVPPAADDRRRSARRGSRGGRRTRLRTAPSRATGADRPTSTGAGGAVAVDGGVLAGEQRFEPGEYGAVHELSGLRAEQADGDVGAGGQAGEQRGERRRRGGAVGTPGGGQRRARRSTSAAAAAGAAAGRFGRQLPVSTRRCARCRPGSWRTVPPRRARRQRPAGAARRRSPARAGGHPRPPTDQGSLRGSAPLDPAGLRRRCVLRTSRSRLPPGRPVRASPASPPAPATTRRLTRICSATILSLAHPGRTLPRRPSGAGVTVLVSPAREAGKELTCPGQGSSEGDAHRFAGARGFRRRRRARGRRRSAGPAAAASCASWSTATVASISTRWPRSAGPSARPSTPTPT